MRKDCLITNVQARAAIELFDHGYGYAATATKLDVHKPTLKLLHDRWLVRGTISFMEPHQPRRIPAEQKIATAKRYLDGEHKVELAKELGLASSRPILDWVKEYRDKGEDAFTPRKASGKGKTARMRAIDHGQDPDADPAPSKPDVMAKKTRVEDISLAEYRQLQDRLLRAEAENAYLKKLKALRQNGQL
ncbi:helix-turn-helix domain-containing protein [Brevibacterium siliguriense]|uniref:helix-turn-helix domain-containing protein n=1 Tax=Brevibacterium siliguriense TaxID=1136497 RepID=UPI000AEF7301|nr:helix-turn-helix domain-containing protein [Brevibacterium siliguriense]